jgi:phage gp29-like protein
MGIAQTLKQTWNNAFGRDKDAKNAQTYAARNQAQRIKLDILAWREAIKEAENPYYPKRVKMQGMYLDTILDGHVSAAMDRRKNMTLLKEFMIKNEAGEEDEALTRMFRKSWFFQLLNFILDANFYGYSLISLGDIVNDEFPEVKILRRNHISPDRFMFVPYPYSLSGWDFMDPNDKDKNGNSLYDWTIYVPTVSDSGVSNCGFGLLYKVARYEILLRNNLTWNADFIEIFGHPTRHAKTNKLEGDEYDRLEEALSTAGAKHWMITDPQDEIEFIEASKGGGKGMDVYDNFESRLEKKISKIILGHADAMDSTAGKLGSQGKDDDSVGKALKEVEVTDNTFAENVINSELLPKMRKLGFKIPEMYSFGFKNDREKEKIRQQQDESNQVTATVVKTLKDAGYKVDPKYIEDRTGIIVTEVEPPAPLITNPNLSKDIKNKLDNLYR